MKQTAIAITALLFSVFIYSCGADQSNAETQSSNNPAVLTADTTIPTQADDAALAGLYGCSMHKELIGVKGDKCPKCGSMKMVPITWSLEGVDTVRIASMTE